MLLQDNGIQLGVLAIAGLEGVQWAYQLPRHEAPMAGAPGDMNPPPDPKVVKLVGFGQAIVSEQGNMPMVGTSGDLPPLPEPPKPKSVNVVDFSFSQTMTESASYQTMVCSGDVPLPDPPKPK